MRCQKGQILLATAVFMTGLLLVLALAIDVGRLYMIRGQLQIAADNAALAAAQAVNPRELQSALNEAQSIENFYGLSRSGVSKLRITISSVEFAPSNTGPWYYIGSVPAEASIKYVRVRTQSVPVNFLFALSTYNEQAEAIASAKIPSKIVLVR